MQVKAGFLSDEAYWLFIVSFITKIHMASFDVIVSAGHETKALLNNNGPRYKRSKLERQMNADVLWCVLILLVMCLFSAIGKCSLKAET